MNSFKNILMESIIEYNKSEVKPVIKPTIKLTGPTDTMKMLTVNRFRPIHNVNNIKLNIKYNYKK